MGVEPKARLPFFLEYDMQPFQQRVVDEMNELAAKDDKLKAFFSTTVFAGLPADEQARLRRQQLHMAGYLNVLRERIAAFS